LGFESEDDDEIQRINKRKMEQFLKSANNSQADGKPITLTDSNFASIAAKTPILVVDFWAAWCGPCRMISPVIEALAKDYSGKVTFGKLNVDENPIAAERFQVRSIPTILIFKDGRAIDGVIGVVPRATLESKIRPYIGESSVSSAPYR
jgi:thioredoxin 1